MVFDVLLSASRLLVYMSQTLSTLKIKILTKSVTLFSKGQPF